MNDRNNDAVFCYEKQARASGRALIIVSTAVLIATGVVLALVKPALSFLPFLLLWVVYIPFLLYGVLLLYRSGGSIRILNDGIEHQQKKKKHFIAFSEVENVKHTYDFFQALELRTAHGTIRIGKNIQGYQQLYDAIANNIPMLAEPPEGPVIMRAAFPSTYLAASVIVLLLCFMIVFMVRMAAQGSLPLFSVLFGGGLAAFFVVFMLVSMLKKPYQFRLCENGVTECAVAKRKNHLKSTITAVQYGQLRAKHYTQNKMARMVNYITFRFADGTSLTIDDQYTAYPIEKAVHYVKKVYGIPPIHAIV